MASRGYRSGSDSRCCQPTEPPLVWHVYVDTNHPGVEELDEWLNSLQPFARNHELGRLDDVFEAAAKGLLEDSGDERTPIKPISKDPEIYELRHKALSKSLRFYHGEPDELPTTLVAVHRHIKTTTEEQEEHIVHAAHRYVDGRDSNWDI